MPLDRFVWWQKTEKRPTKKDIQTLLEDYVRDLALSVEWDKDRFFVVLPGQPSWVFARDPSVSENTRQARLEDRTDDDGNPRPRWFEVYLHEDALDVMTRSMDNITNAIADEFARICARRWHGLLDDN